MDFQVIYDFLVANWLNIISIIFSLVYLILFLTKKKVKVSDNTYCSVLLALPGWINEAEIYKGSMNKLNYVFTKAIQELVRLTGKNKDEVLDLYGDGLIKDIEAVLSTPQKKDARKEK